jgi:hypothetical protein
MDGKQRNLEELAEARIAGVRRNENAALPTESAASQEACRYSATRLSDVQRSL